MPLASSNFKLKEALRTVLAFHQELHDILCKNLEPKDNFDDSLDKADDSAEFIQDHLNEFTEAGRECIYLLAMEIVRAHLYYHLFLPMLGESNEYKIKLVANHRILDQSLDDLITKAKI